MNGISDSHRTGDRIGAFDTRSAWTGAAASPANELHATELVLPGQTNHYGTLFGPNALALLGKTAFLLAARWSRQPVVMACATRVDFLSPVPVGSLLNLRARVHRVGRSSMSIEVRAAVDAAAGTPPQDALSGTFEMVAVDEHGQPTPILRPTA